MEHNLTKQTLDQFFERVVIEYNTRPALAFVDEPPFTYAEFGRRVKTVQENLGRLGLKKQDKVIILGSGSPNWAIAFLAVTTMGAVAVPVMDEFPEADIEHIIYHSEAVTIFIADNLHQSLNLPSLEKMQVIFNLDTLSPFDDDLPGDNLWEQVLDLPQKIKSSSEKQTAEHDPDTIQEDDLAEILYTSGTTGHSKGVMLTHKNLVSNVFAGAELLPGILSEQTVVLSILPMAHSFTSTCGFLTVISRGASIYFLNRKPSPKVLMTAMQQVRPTLIAAVPLIFEKIYHKRVMPAIAGNKMLLWLCQLPPARKVMYRIVGRKVMESLGGRLSCAVIGGASLAPEVETFMREGGIPYLCGYGLSECSPLVAGSPLNKYKMGSVGQAIPNVSIKIVKANPQTGVGEILVKGPNVMKGYYKNEAETEKVFTQDGWLITGDLGYLDEDGFLFIKGRSKNVIVGPSGENVYPEVIEDKLKGSQYVEEALVYLVDNQLIARVYPDYTYIQSQAKNKEESAIAEDITKILEQVRQETNANLPAASRIHKIVEQQTPFIKTPTNKIKRREYVPDYLN